MVMSVTAPLTPVMETDTSVPADRPEPPDWMGVTLENPVPAAIGLSAANTLVCVRLKMLKVPDTPPTTLAYTAVIVDATGTRQINESCTTGFNEIKDLLRPVTRPLVPEVPEVPLDTNKLQKVALVGSCVVAAKMQTYAEPLN